VFEIVQTLLDDAEDNMWFVQAQGRLADDGISVAFVLERIAS